MIIKNYSELEEKGLAAKIALKLIEEGIKAANPSNRLINLLKVKEGTLIIKDKSFQIKGRIFVVGGGKAVGSIAITLEKILGDYIYKGLIIVPEYLKGIKLRRIKVWYGTHPFPSESNIMGTKKIVELLGELKENDIVIALISGGGSSLLSLPPKEIGLEDQITITKMLLNSGADIKEINIVRKHLSKIKGGWLAFRASSATLISLIISDVVGDPLDIIASGPTVPDGSTFNDAISILKRYKLYSELSPNVKRYLEKGVSSEIPETPKPENKVFKRTYNFLIMNNRDILNAVYSKAKELGLNAIILTSYLEGEARYAGLFLSSIIQEIYYHNTPIKKPAAIISGGETTVKVKGKGKGGRNQELVLSAAKKISNLKNVALASVGTDGIDGVTNAAGGLITGETYEAARLHSINIDDYLSDNDSYRALKALKSLVFTGPTGTNVNDFQIGIVIGS